jgi:CheY-like chemotaxis protein
MKPKDPLATSGLPPIKQSEVENVLSDMAPQEFQEIDSKYLILIADDSADNVAMLSLFLQQEGYRVVTASNGEDAIKIASQTLPNLILMDISMPALDGLAATRRIREDERLQSIPVVAISAFGTEGFQRAAYDVGISGYLTKPIDLDRMRVLIGRLLSPLASGELRT